MIAYDCSIAQLNDACLLASFTHTLALPLGRLISFFSTKSPLFPPNEAKGVDIHTLFSGRLLHGSRTAAVSHPRQIDAADPPGSGLHDLDDGADVVLRPGRVDHKEAAGQELFAVD